jgi:hypothetical protein
LNRFFSGTDLIAVTKLTKQFYACKAAVVKRKNRWGSSNKRKRPIYHEGIVRRKIISFNDQRFVKDDDNYLLKGKKKMGNFCTKDEKPG